MTSSFWTALQQKTENGLIVAYLTTMVFVGSIDIADSAENDVPHFSGEFAGLSYVETLTAGASEGDELPMLVSLHYMSGSPETSIADYGGIDVPARLLSLAGPHKYDAGYSWFPDGYYDLDDARQLKVTFDVAERIAQFIQEAADAYPTRGKPILTGFSQGADLTHVIALRESGLILSGISMGGRFPAIWHDAVAEGNELPTEIVLFHGAADAAVDVNESISAATYYTARGVTVSLHTYAGVGHAYPARMKADFELVIKRLMRATDE